MAVTSDTNTNFPNGIAINSVDVSATAAELNAVAGVANRSQSTLAVAAEAGDNIDVTLTVKDADGTAVAAVHGFEVIVSSSATTGAVATDDGITLTATTGLLTKEHTDDLFGKVLTDANGVAVLRLAGAGDLTAKYLWVQFPDGQFKVSAVIDHAA